MATPGRWALACRAMRVPFVGASVLPFAVGYLLAPGAFSTLPLLLGLVCVAAGHLAGNLANELADAASGADAQDRTPYVLFGGSKVMQEGLLSAAWYRHALAACVAIALAGIVALAILLHAPVALPWGGGALLLALAYSLPPWRLMSRGLGEPAVALLFGPATVLAGWACRAPGVAPPPVAWLGAAALGLLTTAVLVANEVPDAADDAAVGKRHLVVRLGQLRGWVLYAALNFAAMVALVGMAFADAQWPPLLAAAATLPAARATAGLRRHPTDKARLLVCSRVAMQVQGAVALILLAQGLF